MTAVECVDALVFEAARCHDSRTLEARDSFRPVLLDTNPVAATPMGCGAEPASGHAGDQDGAASAARRFVLV